MSDIEDPFDGDEMNDIYGRFHADQMNAAVDEAQGELDDAVRTIVVLAERLRQLMPAVAVVNLISSMAVGTAVSQVFGDG